MTAEEIADAEEAVTTLLVPEVARLLRPALPREHRAVLDALDRLSWDVEPIESVAMKALTILKAASIPGGIADPKEDDADVAWTMTLNRMTSVPSVGSKMGRAWYRHGQRLLWADAGVSTVFLGMAAYTVASFEDVLRSDHAVARWLMTAGVETDVDDRPGVGLAVVVRAARLLSSRVT
jgi:hypothetical protein